MSDRTTREPFEELLLPRKELPKLSSRYRIYKDGGGYITVEATSALEALKNCGLPQVRRIERDAIYLDNVLDLAALANIPVPAAPVAVETPVAAPASAPPTPEMKPAAVPVAGELKSAAVPPVADTPLSTTDIDKLLKGENTTGA